MHLLHGPIIRVAPDEISYAHPDAWADILQPKPGGRPPFPKDPTWWNPMPGSAPGIISNTDETLHALLRRHLSPGFTSRAITSHEQIVHQYVDLLIDRWREAIRAGNTEIDIMRWFNYLTFDIFALIFENLKFNGAMIAARFYPLVDGMLAKMIPATLVEAKKLHERLIADKVRRRLDGGGKRLDLMAGVQAAVEEKNGKGLSMRIVNAMFGELAVAGSETSAMALSAAVNLLMHNRDKMEVPVKEVRGRFRRYEEIDAQSTRDVAYLNAVLNEVLRLCPPVPYMPPRRVPEGGGMVCGRLLPAGSRVSITFSCMHRELSSFHDPSSFCPERWLPEATENPDSPFYHDKRHAAQPFLVGPHSCIGQNLAWVEMRVALAKVLWTFDIAAPKDEAKWVRWESLKTFLLIEKRPLIAVLQARTA
ncbi:hypothetical protein OQA88_6023 [Cercophora sp. LCS_1]